MARRKILAGSTSVVVPIFIQDSSSTTGAGLGSLVYNSAGLAAKYRRQGDSSWTTISLVTATAGTFTSSGFIADGGPVTGGYELGIPNAALASGATWVQIALYGATNMLAVLLEIELDAVNYQDATRFGLSALPNANAGASGGLPLSVDTSGRVDVLKINGTSQTARDIGASVLLSAGTGTGQLDITSGVVKANATQLAGQTITAAAGVTFPSSVASPTNITAGTITTATNLTNLPSIPAGWLTASGIAASALNGKGDWNTTAPDNTTIGTIATNIGTNGSGLTAIGDTRLNNLDDAVSDAASAAASAASSASSAASSAATAATQATNAASQTTAANIRTAVGLAAANLDTQLGAIPTTFRLKKNTAFSGFSLVMFNTSGVAATGKTVSGSVSIDGGAFGTLTNSVSEIGSGAYKVNLAAADTNGNDLLFLFTATDCKPLFLKVITQP